MNRFFSNFKLVLEKFKLINIENEKIILDTDLNNEKTFYQKTYNLNSEDFTESDYFQPQFPIEGNDYLIKQTDKLKFKTVLDIGLGNGCASAYFANKGKKVTALGVAVDSYDMNCEELNKMEVDISETYFEEYQSDKKYDAIWMSHVLEHTQNVGIFLEKARNLLNDDGWLFVMVPPHKHEVVGGHLTNGWNLGQLMYNLLVAGYDIKNGHFIKFGYNICAFVQKAKYELPLLRGDNGDIETTKDLWPLDVYQAFNGDLEKINWLE